jgi:hypothetical protein
MPLTDGQHDMLAMYYRSVLTPGPVTKRGLERSWSLREFTVDVFLVAYIAAIIVLGVVIAFGVVRQLWP